MVYLCITQFYIVLTKFYQPQAQNLSWNIILDFGMVEMHQLYTKHSKTMAVDLNNF
jgi:hypothetical protein